MPKKILVAVDGSDNAQKALAEAATLSAATGADLAIVHVLMHGRPAQELARMAEVEHVIRHMPSISPPRWDAPPSMTQVFDQPVAETARAVVEIGDYILAGARRDAEEAGAKNVETLTRDGDYADAILDAASDTGADLIVVGRRGLGRLRRAIVGSVSNKVLQNAECSVLAVI